jgi:hypothetical protein
MVVLFTVFWIGVVAVLAASVLIYRTVSAAPRWLRPVGWAHDLADRIPPVVAGLLIALAGTQAVFLLGLPMGWGAAALEHRVDEPAFRWIYRNAIDDSFFTHVMNVLTKMGNIHQIRIACVVGALALGLAWRRRFYIPPLVILATFILEKFAQKGLGKIIDRGHPPTTLGTYPSGGVGRLMSIYGVMIFLALLLVPHLARKWKFAAWTALALAAWTEAYSRAYLSKHWLTDAVTGLVFGGLLMIAVVAGTAALTRRIVPVYGSDDEPAPAQPRVSPNGRHAHSELAGSAAANAAREVSSG